MGRRTFWIALIGVVVAGEALGYSLTGRDWSYQAAPVEEPFLLNVGSFPSGFGPRVEIEDAYVSAMDRWTFDSGANIVYDWGGTTSRSSWAADADNIGQWYSYYPGATLALAQFWSTAGGNILDCDIRFFGQNDMGDIRWSTNPSGASAGRLDFELTAVHELGHCLGLNHSSDPHSVMRSGQPSGTGPSHRELGADDKAAVQHIYGTSQGRLEFSGFSIVDQGDGDGLLEPGEEFSLVFDVDNPSAVDMRNVRTTTSTTDADLTVLQATGTPRFGSRIDAYSADEVNGTRLRVDASCDEDRDATVRVALQADGFSDTVTLQVPLACGSELEITSGHWHPGGRAWVEVSGAQPFETVRLVLSTGGLGTGFCPAPLGGLCWDIERPLPRRRTLTADASGIVRWYPHIPPTVPPGTQVWVQAGIPRGPGGASSVLSPVESAVIQP